jgi:DNA transformation protein
MAHPPFVEHCLELLVPLGRPRAKRMFGGHGLYVDDVFVALIANERLYLKADAATRPRFEAAGCEPFVYEANDRSIALGYWSAPSDALESPALMMPWGRLALEAALRAALKRKAPPAASTAAAAASARKRRRSAAR